MSYLITKHHSKIGQIVLAITLCGLLLYPSITAARNPADPGKGFDYVFWGYSPPHPNPGCDNRAVLLLDIDDATTTSPRLSSRDKQFKYLAASPASGRLDVKTVVQPVTPTFSRLFGIQTDHPERFIFTWRGIAEQGIVFIAGNALLEADGLHYLRAVVDVVHNGKRTRYLVNCECFDCDAP